MTSVTSIARPFVAPYLSGVGLDLGYGGDAILPTSINVDLPEPYTKVGSDPQHIACDATSLSMFCDGSLDYVYSSHLLEDFEDTASTLLEWARVLKSGGVLALCLPDERKYRDHCKAMKQGRNMHHKHQSFCVEHVIDSLPSGVRPVHVQELAPYSFIIVAKKE